MEGYCVFKHCQHVHLIYNGMQLMPLGKLQKASHLLRGVDISQGVMGVHQDHGPHIQPLANRLPHSFLQFVHSEVERPTATATRFTVEMNMEEPNTAVQMHILSDHSIKWSWNEDCIFRVTKHCGYG